MQPFSIGPRRPEWIWDKNLWNVKKILFRFKRYLKYLFNKKLKSKVAESSIIKIDLTYFTFFVSNGI